MADAECKKASVNQGTAKCLGERILLFEVAAQAERDRAVAFRQNTRRDLCFVAVHVDFRACVDVCRNDVSHLLLFQDFQNDAPAT